MMLEFYGPETGNTTDSTMMGNSGLLNRFKMCVGPIGSRYHMYIYGDPAYAQGAYLMTPYKGRRRSRVQMKFNKNLARRRIAVEWAFGKMQEEWGFFAVKKNQKVFSAPVSNRYKVAALLTNFHSCLYGNNASRFFGVATPSLESYIAGQPDS